ncbi:MAG TPA: ATP-binding cassette domain-containing protein [Acidimicrobiales bacterium]|nr:ATP-binding cassette domain-containing protein [Acidimicrobiales bacterium]
MLQLDDLHRRYGDVQALAGLSFSVARGQVVGFVGRNGAGKTTAMRIALGLTRADRGSVTWDGRPVEPDQRRTLFGYLPEERGLYPKMWVIDQLRYFGELHGLSRVEATSRAERWLDDLGLGDRRRAMVDDLSLGNQQRVQLVAALLHGPEALVLDEPFSGLDPVGVDALAGALAGQVDRGAAVVFSSHQLELVERLCDSVVIIDAGRLVASGTIDEVRRRHAGRRIEVVFAPTGAGTAVAPTDGRWLEGLLGVQRAEHIAGAWRVDLAEDADDQVVLDAARHVGAVERFGPVVATLSDLFREVVH